MSHHRCCCLARRGQRRNGAVPRLGRPPPSSHCSRLRGAMLGAVLAAARQALLRTLGRPRALSTASQQLALPPCGPGTPTSPSPAHRSPPREPFAPGLRRGPCAPGLHWHHPARHAPRPLHALTHTTGSGSAAVSVQLPCTAQHSTPPLSSCGNLPRVAGSSAACRSSASAQARPCPVAVPGGVPVLIVPACAKRAPAASCWAARCCVRAAPALRVLTSRPACTRAPPAALHAPSGAAAPPSWLHTASKGRAHLVPVEVRIVADPRHGLCRAGPLAALWPRPPARAVAARQLLVAHAAAGDAPRRAPADACTAAAAAYAAAAVCLLFMPEDREGRVVPGQERFEREPQRGGAAPPPTPLLGCRCCGGGGCGCGGGAAAVRAHVDGAVVGKQHRAAPVRQWPSGTAIAAASPRRRWREA